MLLEVEVGEVLATGRQLMPDQGEAIFDGGFDKAVVELFAGGVLVRENMEASSKFQVQGSKKLSIFTGQERCGRNGDGLVACGK